jgi:hypothetical protein
LIISAHLLRPSHFLLSARLRSRAALRPSQEGHAEHDG